MKKILILSTLIAITLSSCLKDDKHYTDFASAGNVVNFPNSGTANFGHDALTQDTSSVSVVADYATANANPAISVTIAIDTTLVAKYNAANPAISYFVMPAAVYKLAATTINIAAGAQYSGVNLTVYKNLLDPSKSYMLPIKIVSATAGIISSNQNVHYYHVIGNDFAGFYNHFYTRWATPDSTSSPVQFLHIPVGTSIFNPISPTEFTVQTYYYTGPRYDVNFVKTGSGASATYSGWSIKFFGTDIADQFTPNGLTVVNQPSFLPEHLPNTPNPFDPAKQYTYQESLALFRFYFTTASRVIIDTYIKQ